MMLIGNVSKIFRMLAVIGCAVASAIISLDMFLVPVTVHLTATFSLWNTFMALMLILGLVTMYFCVYIFFLGLVRRVPDLFMCKVDKGSIKNERYRYKSKKEDDGL